jgi:hypothetical protein
VNDPNTSTIPTTAPTEATGLDLRDRLKQAAEAATNPLVKEWLLDLAASEEYASSANG